MHKITKGLKKKKKGKKSKKNKEEELFKPEELEAYRREHQQQSTETAASAESDEWRKFQALTAGIDNVLRKTQGDLDRIKSTSFFQRIIPQSDIDKAEAEEQLRVEADKSKTEAQQSAPQKPELPHTLGVVAFSESESEEDGDDEDDIFDTSFVDAIATGEVKLAYIPESPTFDDAAGDDPFDTSIAERAILGPAFEKKGKKLVPLGAAVEVLTGRVEQVTCATKKPSIRRKFKQQDLLLGSFDFDTNGNTTDYIAEKPSSTQQPKSLLDDDTNLLDDVPIDLSGASLHPVPDSSSTFSVLVDPTKDLINEFDLINKKGKTHVADEEDDEFALLAAESIAKKPQLAQVILPLDSQENTEWNTFDAEFEKQFDEPKEEDPFDTTFAENILPGRAELKLIENEILNSGIVDILPKVEENFSKIIKSQVSIHITNPGGERESISSLDRIDESCLTSLQTIHRDLLGGSNTDLSNIGDDPITPNQPTVDDSLSDYSDPFDTSTVDQVTVPGQAELKFIEKEILGEVTINRSLSDPDFNPREESESPKAIRPDILVVNSVRSVGFALPTPSSQPDLLATGEQEIEKHTKPLTPYYVRANSISEASYPNDDEVIEDPFDTSFVSELAPGKAELKLIESEFIEPETQLKKSFSDEDFDPRAAEKKPNPEQKISNINVTSVPLILPLKEVQKPDLLAVDDDVSAKVLTPAVESASNFEISYSDPFDTSIACNILPGKTELKLIENELIHTQIKRSLTDPEFDPRNSIDEEQQVAPGVHDLLDNTEEQVAVKPLTPVDYHVSFEIGDEDIDPFDTSVADNLAPGRTELKLLESELI